MHITEEYAGIPHSGLPPPQSTELPRRFSCAFPRSVLRWGCKIIDLTVWNQKVLVASFSHGIHAEFERVAIPHAFTIIIVFWFTYWGFDAG